jgi:hypothetical protein
MIKVYIASPYTHGDVAQNVHNSFLVASQIRRIDGVMPIAPLRAHFEHLCYPQQYETWMAEDHEYIKISDALFRLPGHSSGASREVKWADELNIPIFHKWADLFEWLIDQV